MNWEEELAKWVAIRMECMQRDPMLLYICHQNIRTIERSKENTMWNKIIEIPEWYYK